MFEFFELDTSSTSELYPFPFVGQSPWLAQSLKMVAAPIPPIQQHNITEKAPASAIQAQ